MDKIYIFSGLGVDKRVFQFIDFTGLDVEFVDWIEPLDNESLKSYAKRISAFITVPNPILIGLSFGGIVAVEISKIIETKNVILIASAKNKNELPKMYRTIGKIKINKLVPNSFLKNYNWINTWMFGIHTKSDKQLFKTILSETNSKFLQWAINEIVNWENEENPTKWTHIHGNKDRIIPIKNVQVDFIIDNAGHFMTINKSKEIEQIIKKQCN